MMIFSPSMADEKVVVVWAPNMIIIHFQGQNIVSNVILELSLSLAHNISQRQYFWGPFFDGYWAMMF